MLEKKTDWVLADKLISKDINLPQKTGSRSQLTRDGRFIDSPSGIIARVQSDQIKRKAGLSFDREWYEAQLKVSKHQLQKAVELKIKETDADVERLLTDISRKHLEYLTEMGLRNSDQREEALERLSDQTATRIKRLQSKDWPEMLMEQTINGVIELHQRFFDKILAD